jgi:hypothetical protein
LERLAVLARAHADSQPAHRSVPADTG